MPKNKIKITYRIILMQQEGGYAEPAIELQPPVGTYIERRYMSEVFEDMCNKKLRDVEGWEPSLDCGEYEITIKRIIPTGRKSL